MPRSFRDDWDTPGGHGGREVLESLAVQLGRNRGWSAKALHRHWREVMAEVVQGRVLKSTVSPQEFNTFRRRRLDEGLTDEQLALSFEVYATAVIYGPARVYHNDLWRTYAGTWARWTSQVPAPATGPLEGQSERSDWQR